MRTLQIRLEQHVDGPPAAVWPLIADPQVSAGYQSAGEVTRTSGTPGTLGFEYVLSSRSGGRRDTVVVVEAQEPRLLREQVTSDLFARRLPGEVLHLSEQVTALEPDRDGTRLRWQLTTQAPWYARGWMRWRVRRTVSVILRGIAADAGRRGR